MSWVETMELEGVLRLIMDEAQRKELQEVVNALKNETENVKAVSDGLFMRLLEFGGVDDFVHLARMNSEGEDTERQSVLMGKYRSAHNLIASGIALTEPQKEALIARYLEILEDAKKVIGTEQHEPSFWECPAGAIDRRGARTAAAQFEKSLVVVAHQLSLAQIGRAFPVLDDFRKMDFIVSWEKGDVHSRDTIEFFQEVLSKHMRNMTLSAESRKTAFGIRNRLAGLVPRAPRPKAEAGAMPWKVPISQMKKKGTC
ncbi:MAG: hypothetical protein ABII71_04080 [Candidatus Micrarchaeota archaeon]